MATNEISKIVSSISKYEDQPTWPEAKPLPKSHFAVQQICEEHVPCSIREWIVDTAERMQVPLEFIAAPAIVAASSVVGRKIGIKPRRVDDWLVISNLWGFLVADPGAMKSPSISAALEPLERLQNEATNKFYTKLPNCSKRRRSIQREIDALKQTMKIDSQSGFLDEF